MRRKQAVASRVERDEMIDSLSTEWLVKWPRGSCYRVIERDRQPGFQRYEILTAVRRQPVGVVQYGRLLHDVEVAIYNAKTAEARASDQ